MSQDANVTSGSAEASSSGAASALDKLAALTLRGTKKKETKEKYAFWETQPVMQFTDEGSSMQVGSSRCCSPSDVAAHC
jgi:hypothetical protein